MVNVNDITITSLETINAFNVVSGSYKFTLDELQSSKIANSEEKTDITGKNGRKLSSLKKNKAVTVSGTNGLVSGGMLETQVGGTITHKTDAPVMVPDYLTISSNAATTSYKAVGTAGNEIETVYIRNDDDTLGEALTQSDTAETGKFTYDPDTGVITFAEGEYADGTEIAVFYFREVEGDVLENMSDSYSTKATLYIDAFGEDRCGRVYRIQFYIPKADFSGTFDIELGENQTVHAFEAESLSGGACKSNGTSGSLWRYTIFGESDD